MDSDFTKINDRAKIPSQVVNSIEEYHNRYSPKTDTAYYSNLSEIYSDGDENWNMGCTIGLNLPRRKFDHLYFSESNLVIAYYVGGIGVSPFYDFYTFGNGHKLEKIKSVNIPYFEPSLFHLAVVLRLEPDLYFTPNPLFQE